MSSSTLANWSVRRRAAQLVVAPVEESEPLTARRLVAEGIGVLLLFGSYAPPTLPTDLARLRAHADGRLAPLVMTDEEGGEIQRMANLVGDLPWPREMAKTMTTGQVRALAKKVGRRMRSAGVTMDLAPVLDLSDGPWSQRQVPRRATVIQRRPLRRHRIRPRLRAWPARWWRDPGCEALSRAWSGELQHRLWPSRRPTTVCA